MSKTDPLVFSNILITTRNEGHEISLHAPYDFKPNIKSRFWGQFTKAELTKAKKELEKLTGQKIKYYRPHYFLQPITILYANAIGLKTVLGNFIHYSDPTESIDKQILKFSNASSGEILIFHNGTTTLRKGNNVTKVLPEVLENLYKKGLQPTKISDSIC